MANNEQIIWSYFEDKGFSKYGIAGLMGNLYAESGLYPQNLQNTYNSLLGFTDAEYTKAVNSKRKELTTDEARKAFRESFDWEKITEQDESVWAEIFNALDN